MNKTLTMTMNTITTKCLITVSRDEDVFLEEWITYHLNLGFDHIYICDNNSKYPILIENDQVTIYDMRLIDFSIKGIYNTQCDCYKQVIKNIKNLYSYCAICDVDEFFYFKNLTLDEFINKYLNNTSMVEIPWEVYDDNDLIFHSDLPVLILYPHILDKMDFNWEKNECSWGKSIFKLSDNLEISPHRVLNYPRNVLNKDIAVVKHYRTRCLEDYIKGKCYVRNAINANFTKGHIIKTYFDFNKVNLDKLIHALKFCYDCNIKLTASDRMWVLNLFNKFCPITVVVRTHSRIELLKECIKSIKQQTYKCKILVLNDGSKDNTVKWLSKQSLDFLSFENNVGPGEILHRGKYLITTPYYIICDDDDVWTSINTIEFFYNNIIDNPYLDVLSTGKSYHAVCLVNTLLLIQCPTLSLFTKDDHYFYWIKRHAKNYIKGEFNFYNYRKNIITTENSHHVDLVQSGTPLLSFSFFRERNYSEITNHIKNHYHIYPTKERKALDQMLLYMNSI